MCRRWLGRERAVPSVVAAASRIGGVTVVFWAVGDCARESGVLRARGGLQVSVCVRSVYVAK